MRIVTTIIALITACAFEEASHAQIPVRVRAQPTQCSAECWADLEPGNPMVSLAERGRFRVITSGDVALSAESQLSADDAFGALQRKCQAAVYSVYGLGSGYHAVLVTSAQPATAVRQLDDYAIHGRDRSRRQGVSQAVFVRASRWDPTVCHPWLQLFYTGGAPDLDYQTLHGGVVRP